MPEKGKCQSDSSKKLCSVGGSVGPPVKQALQKWNSPFRAIAPDAAPAAGLPAHHAA